ncbi:MAG: cytosol aminopeptidase [Comamonadaceae bacterium BICA1-1]|nr:MAG: cytosol aminopeptidase [Comamonadaceae bacterium BICA1-1]
MDFELKTLTLQQAASVAADALIVLWPDGADVEGAAAGAVAATVKEAKVNRGSASAAAAGTDLAQWARAAVADADIEQALGSVLLAHRLPGVQARKVALVRSGDASPAATRKAVLAAVAALKLGGARQLLLWAGDVSAGALAALLQATADASYSYTTTKPKAKARALQSVAVAVRDAAPLQAALAQACACVKGVEWAKEWANRPPNHATPTLLAEAAQQLAQGKRRLQVEVLGPKEVEQLGMGAYLAVAQGSEEPLRFIVLKYQGAPKASAPVVLVGKGITFDTGGISLKPGPEMDEMKFDMGGAAAVLGTFVALADLQPEINVVGLVPCCENMPDGRAVKPGDVVTSLSGQTIEILNTDAEGRLILCDALTYAARFKPRALIDVATLTGACVIALGNLRAGLYSNRDELAQVLQVAGEATLDPCWRMPLDDEYEEGLKSNFADMANIAGRPAGSVTAAKFLQKFVAPEQAWAHLDIAGVAWKSGAAKGATGRPVALLLRYLLDEAARLDKESALPPKAEAGAKRRKR